MASTLKIPSPLRRFTDGQESLEVDGKNVEEVLNELFAKYPDIKNHLIENDGNLRNFVKEQIISREKFYLNSNYMIESDNISTDQILKLLKTIF